MSAALAEPARSFRHDLVEVLKQLNRAAEEEPDVGGIELGELLANLRRGPCPALTGSELEVRLSTLLANRLAETLERPVTSWERGRVLGRRYRATAEGKRFLLQQIQRTGRIT